MTWTLPTLLVRYSTINYQVRINGSLHEPSTSGLHYETNITTDGHFLCEVYVKLPDNYRFGTSGSVASTTSRLRIVHENSTAISTEDPIFQSVETTPTESIATTPTESIEATPTKSKETTPTEIIDTTPTEGMKTTPTGGKKGITVMNVTISPIEASPVQEFN